jgi:hypothetical protein
MKSGNASHRQFRQWLLAVMLGACCSVPARVTRTDGGATGMRVEKSAMSLQLSLKVPVEPVVSGTPLPVRTVVRNTGAVPVDLPPPGTLSPLTFVLRDSSGRVAASGGAQDAISGRLGVPAPVPAPAQVLPGKEVSYDDDVSSYFGRSIAPGKYDLFAELRRAGVVLASVSAAVTVEALVPDAAVRAAGSTGKFLSTLVAHRHANGHRTVYYSFADMTGRWKGALRPVLSFASGSPASIAVVPLAMNDPSFSWAGEIDGDLLRAILVRPFDTTFSIGPIRLGTGGARLLETGVPLPEMGALMLGVSDDGTSLVVIRVGRGGTSAVNRLQVPMTLATSPFVAVSAAAGSDLVHVFWVEADRTVNALTFHSAEPGQQPSIKAVYQVSGRVVGMQADPPGSGPQAGVFVVELPVSVSAPPRLTHLVAGHTGTPDTVTIAPPPASVRDARRWLLPSSEPSASGPIAVPAGSTTWLLQNGAWRTMALPVEEPRRSRLIRYGDGGLWISTWSTHAGLDLRRIP